MPVRIQMLGTGTMFAKKYDNNNAIVTSNHFNLLIDCGITAPRALQRLGIPCDRLNGVLITHLHADHVGGLEVLAFQMKYVYKKRPTLYIAEKLVQPLWENTLKGGMIDPSQGLDSLESYFDVVPLQENVRTEIHDGFHLELKETRHIDGKASYSVFINDLLFYSADVRFDKDLIDWVYRERQCRYILHDCQLKGPETVHATLDQLLTLSPEIQERIRLMHYDDHMESFIGRTGKMTFLRQDETYDFTF